MIEEYLEQLKQILVKHHYDDVDNAISYMREFAQDRKELGESEESIVASFGDINETASSILGEEVKNADVTSHLKEINAELVSADLTIDEANVSDVEVSYTDDKRFTITDKDGVLTIKEKKKEHNFFFGFKKAEVIIRVPVGYSVESSHLEGVSSDIHMDHFNTTTLHIETVSGDVKLKRSEIEKLTDECVSGDTDIQDCSIKKIEIDSVSGDIEIKNVKADQIFTESISGDTEIKNTTFDHVHGTSTSGDVEVVATEPKENYNVQLDKLFHSKEYGTGVKSIKLETTTGNLDVDFK